MASVTAGKPAELAYLDRSVAGAEAALDALLDAVGASLDAVGASVLTRLGSIKSLSTVTVSMASSVANATATIAAVNTGKTIVIPLGGNSYGAVISDTVALVSLSSSTAVYFQRNTAASSASFKAMVIEFN